MSGGDEYRDASRRPPPVSLPGGSRLESSVGSSSSSVDSANVRARIKLGSAMATTTTTRLRAVNTCEETSSSLRNGLTFRGAEEAGRINGYTSTTNGHVHVSSRRSGQPPLVLATRFDLVSPDPIYISDVCNLVTILCVQSHRTVSSSGTRESHGDTVIIINNFLIYVYINLSYKNTIFTKMMYIKYKNVRCTFSKLCTVSIAKIEFDRVN